MAVRCFEVVALELVCVSPRLNKIIPKHPVDLIMKSYYVVVA